MQTQACVRRSRLSAHALQPIVLLPGVASRGFRRGGNTAHQAMFCVLYGSPCLRPSVRRHRLRLAACDPLPARALTCLLFFFCARCCASHKTGAGHYSSAERRQRNPKKFAPGENLGASSVRRDAPVNGDIHHATQSRRNAISSTIGDVVWIGLGRGLG